MIKYQLTQNGKNRYLLYKNRNSNRISLEEKVLSILRGGVSYDASSMYDNVARDPAVNNINVSQGTILEMLKGFDNDGYTISYESDDIKRPSGGDVING